MLIATLVAPDTLAQGDISAVCDAVRGRAGPVIDGVACDIACEGADAPAVRAAIEALNLPCDVIVQAAADRAKALLIADMDSTMITVECIDELADYAGIKPAVAAITERAMRGEIDFAGALTERVALLKGMDADIIAECLRERVRIMPGAKALVRTLVARGGTAVLVSGGFVQFADPVAADIGFTRAIANRLLVRDGRLTGEVAMPIVDAQTKLATLKAVQAELGLPRNATLAVGDGANDIPMIAAAGLGVAYHAKPVTEVAAAARIHHGDLSVLLYAMGLARRDWAAAD